MTGETGKAPLQEHWDAAYSGKPDDRLSWYQDAPQPSLDLIERHGPGPAASVIDIGAGAAHLADALLARGYGDITLLDISEAALAATRDRLGSGGGRIRYLAADITRWQPARRWDIWHDRAVMHFLVDAADQHAYRRAFLDGTAAGALAVIGTFAPDGPERCSGLPVRRWSAEELAGFLGPEVTLLESRRHLHETPGGVAQQFDFAVLRRR